MIGVRKCMKPGFSALVPLTKEMRFLEYNPRYFEEPEKFKPSRWYGVPAESDMFTAFSVGVFLDFVRLLRLNVLIELEYRNQSMSW